MTTQHEVAKLGSEPRLVAPKVDVLVPPPRPQGPCGQGVLPMSLRSSGSQRYTKTHPGSILVCQARARKRNRPSLGGVGRTGQGDSFLGSKNLNLTVNTDVDMHIFST